MNTAFIFVTHLITNPSFPEWLAAIGTIMTAFLAFYFGIFGNRETRLLRRQLENELDQEAFKFLTQIPEVITSHLDDKTEYSTNKKTAREFISDFEKLVLEKIILS